MNTIVLYVSGHGFGHATRSAALAGALGRLAPDVRLLVRTRAPHWFFKEENPKVECSVPPPDVGMIQANSLDIDVPGSLAAHEVVLRTWERDADGEAAFLTESEASLVIGDVPPLSFEAAGRAGVPSFALCNFTWDWLVEPYAAKEARWETVRARYASAYSRAEEWLRLPFSPDLPLFSKSTAAPLLVRGRKLSRTEARARIRVPKTESRPLVLVSFGGLEPLGPAPQGAEDLSGFRFVSFLPKPEGLKTEWTLLPQHCPLRSVDLAAACDAVLSKPGYGIISESISQKLRFLYLGRDDFRETPFLVRGLKESGVARELPRADFLACRWREGLEDLVSRPWDRPPVPDGGADFLARALISRIGGRQ